MAAKKKKDPTKGLTSLSHEVHIYMDGDEVAIYFAAEKNTPEENEVFLREAALTLSQFREVAAEVERLAAKQVTAW